MMESRKRSRKSPEPPLSERSHFGVLPFELVRAIVEASPHPLYVYIQMLRVSHEIRSSIRGTLRVLSFDELPDDPVLPERLQLTPEVLVALVGPCRSLRKLSFPDVRRGITVTDDASAGGWVDETFGGHTQLVVLKQLPAFSAPTIERILRHLPGLVELTASPGLRMTDLQLLAENQTTLRSLRLTLHLTRAQVTPLLASLCALSQLAKLDLSLHSLAGADARSSPLHIASNCLRELRLCIEKSLALGLTLGCPALVELELTGAVLSCLTSLQCPRLRTLRVAADKGLKGVSPMSPMPNLEEAVFSPGQLAIDPAWLLTGSSPRLRMLSDVRLTRPDLLAALCACRSLVHLDNLHLNAALLPNPLVVRLPEQLERLLLVHGRHARSRWPPNDLQVEAPGLLDCCVAINDRTLRMELKAGTVVTVIHPDNGGWTFVHNPTTNQDGFCPSAYLTECSISGESGTIPGTSLVTFWYVPWYVPW
ncbi:hypothetical protein PAPYR_10014 [Paratrimastix pyriformis]|uniref:SH3 domain-containing protein n=1 Tax=Paratrimastix pyriformis TaxID=342808 RepID=A0ABQ8U6Y3_9EUKA|nr:hypothetical protein PAPYR_10014 [Paratrimastix pyriformis]